MNTTYESNLTGQPSIDGLGKTLFTEWDICWGTGLGGPIVGGYLLAHNFKSLNRPTEAKYALLVGAIITVFFLQLVLLIPEHIADKIPTQLSHILWAIFIYFVVKRFQKDAIQNHLENGGKKGSGWMVFLSGVIGALITVVYIFVFVAATSSNDTTINDPESLAPLAIANTKGTLYYDSLNIKEQDAKVVGMLLTQIGCFNPEIETQAKYFKLESKYIVRVLVLEQYWNEPQVNQSAKFVLHHLSKTYSNRSFCYVLTSVDSLGVYKDKTID